MIKKIIMMLVMFSIFGCGKSVEEKCREEMDTVESDFHKIAYKEKECKNLLRSFNTYKNYSKYRKAEDASFIMGGSKKDPHKCEAYRGSITKIRRVTEFYNKCREYLPPKNRKELKAKFKELENPITTSIKITAKRVVPKEYKDMTDEELLKGPNKLEGETLTEQLQRRDDLNDSPEYKAA